MDRQPAHVQGLQKVHHRPKALADSVGALQGASPHAPKMASGACVMKLDDVDEFLDDLERPEMKAKW